MSLASRLMALLTRANTKTGKEDSTLTQAVNTLIDGYGSGGGGSDIDAVMDKTITSIQSNASNVPEYFFRNCTKLVSVSAPNTTKVYTYAFSGCTDLEVVNVENVTEISSYAFRSCAKLKNINLPKATSIGTYAFSNCSALESFESDVVTTLGTSVFEGCTKLENVVLKETTSIGSSTFANCSSLKVVDLHKVKSIGSSFPRSTIKNLIIRSDNLCSYTNSISSSDPISVTKIYVPRALLDSYKTATNWSRYASRFVAIEDYSDDGTVMGNIP